ncbi:hypothetical protein [Selenomonas sp. AB3002]|uniref:hypothetical protein n=1 Tax=Selenomonas sp. AB3002 TaxID=1392502 RepID=UPI0004964616
MDKDEFMKAWLAKPDRTQVENKDFGLKDALDRLKLGNGVKAQPAQIPDGARIYQAAVNLDEEKRAKAGETGPLGRKRRIAFVAYSADMWDALATIHAEAMKDAGADVHTIVVPWYERDENGQPAVQHDESSKFPRGIVLTPWQHYDYRQIKPDIVFCHNPYDDFNVVSMIQPEFFLRFMRPFVRTLVYVPYFVSFNGFVPKDRLMSAGLDHADLIPMENDHIRNQYLEVYKKFGIDNNCWERMEPGQSKFVSLGSPKLDRVRFPEPEDFEIPEEWKGVLLDANQQKKPAVFYNISVQTFFDRKEKMLDKIEAVLNTFKLRQEKVAFIWRPHPLYRESIAKSYPEGLARYDRLVAEFRTEKWGIYDDTSNMYRSMILSDMYYGDWSSVVTLYRMMDKPLLIQQAW